MNYSVATPTPGSRWADTISHITATEAAALVADKFTGVFLYAEQVTQSDIDLALSAGLQVAFVMFSPAPGYQPSAALGASMATVACQKLRALNLPAGLTLFIDLESMGGLPADKIAHANAAAAVIVKMGFIAGGYIGAGVGLTSAELYALLVTLYWKSGSIVLDRNGQHAEPGCGWAVVQGMPFDYKVPGGGPEVDLDVVWEDYRGRTVVVLRAA
jgi:hypothetical protein